MFREISITLLRVFRYQVQITQLNRIGSVLETIHKIFQDHCLVLSTQKHHQLHMEKKPHSLIKFLWKNSISSCEPVVYVLLLFD